ncbi:ABC transporter substrate-binding protein [Thalassobaculum sp. OXR-137]|uniref:ABC transporter substrate-binding protein n=1 Tax=Thalassobaculum sp. OXR-137 TaxID=3100173 RepID=UPI002AC8DE70|nr:ABC transporter substrate-binding protein [Thalassobaculum sp. OXR-137]WPZ36792.1 ABC transporter substrate-binding protein [Thalassobaculum sp. OXR-137]
MTDPVLILQKAVDLRDPHDCTDSGDALALLDAIFDAPVRRRPDGGYAPALAERWEVSVDARTWTLHLRDGLSFHDGRPLDAAAMARSIARMQRPDVGATLGAPAVWGQYLGGAIIAAPDARTVTIATREPLADLLDILVSAYAVPPEVDDAGFLSAPVGSGAYRVDAVEPGRSVRLSANPDWWDTPPANPVLEFRCEPDADARAAAVAQGRAGVATRLRASRQKRRVEEAGRAWVDFTDPTSIILILNAAKGPCADPRVRLALSLAVDRQRAVDRVLDGDGVPLTGYVSAAHLGADLVPGDGLDLERARGLLAEAGHGAGLTLHVDTPTRLPDEAQALVAEVAEQLAGLGVTLVPHVTEDRVAYAEQVRDKRIHDLCVFDSSPMSTFRVLYEKIDSRVAGSWWEGYRDPAIEDLLDTARRETDTERREELYSWAYQALLRNPAWLSLYHHRFGIALSQAPQASPMRDDGVLDVTLLAALDPAKGSRA